MSFHSKDRGEATKTSIVAAGRRKILSTYADGSEMMEEFDQKTDQIIVRKWREKSNLGQWLSWVWDIGEPVSIFNPEKDLIAASSSNPLFLRKDTPTAFSWRVRNLPYPPETYSVTIDDEAQQIIIRTSNKKYYKRITVDDLKRAGTALDAKDLLWKHQNNTLVIWYKKSEQMQAAENNWKQERSKLQDKTPMEDAPKEDCKTQ